ncbi:MAG: bifunctional [glutamate--ammonia ligase]-adenylyl-L-tyrosine phosphorylase/[glutamate--ammonia-ligase] adenylyltransferase, partial [Candidatus Binatia bacterium]|nr:bifunctional [glutamate--ammonia ligase]-adenylyl-L-tyrosine phosphorylase/[glutamate--ammonia-ligase] adenylyltransferase [Candidatus Binatia bacterium]
MKNLDKTLSKLRPTRRKRIEQLIHGSPSPALAQATLQRLIDAGNPSSLAKIPDAYLPALFRVLGGSTYLSGLLVREEKAWPEFFLRQIKVPQRTTAEHISELAPLRKKEIQLEQLAKGLRRHKQREILRIGARDLSSATVQETMRELTALAEASLQISYLACRSHVERDFGPLHLPGTEHNNGFAILGMGKLGGGELNFSSDIDLIYFYEEEEGDSLGGLKGKTGAREFFSRLGERITRVMGDITEDGFVFRTDLRLRPLGRNGPLVQSVNSALLYYESWGQCWERSALIKARPVAGEMELGEKFFRELQPFVYRRYLDFSTVEELREMRMRIEQELLKPGQKERNLKLGPGGIREIEFFTQALQLVNGGYEPGIRDRNTIRALEQLARHGFIPKEEKSSLSEAYLFLRNVEHKIQMLQEQQTHSIPEGEEEEKALARRLGYSLRNSRDLFWEDYRRHTAQVRQTFERLFFWAQKEISADSTPTSAGIWNDLDQEEVAVGELKGLGFENPEKTYHNLLAIRDGAPFSPPSPRRLKVMRTLGPALITGILRSGSPDQALFNLAEFIHRVGARTGFLSLLSENPKTMRLLIDFFAHSQFLTDLFLRRPELLDSLIRVDLTRPRKSSKEMGKEVTASLAEQEDLEGKLNALRRYRGEEFLRIGLHDLGGELELEEIVIQLSDLADACLEGALGLSLQVMNQSYGELRKGKFAILGIGKLGGREIDYNSDLDLIFIYDANDKAKSKGGTSGKIDAHGYYTRLGQKLLTFLSSPMTEGIAYKIDMRLRPSGRAGPVVSSLDSFRHYHKTSSELWERQALIKARCAAGDGDLGAATERLARNFAYGKGITK